jgi:hypothetical protein
MSKENLILLSRWFITSAKNQNLASIFRIADEENVDNLQN